MKSRHWLRQPQISPLSYALSKNISRKGPRNRRSLRFPGFPVETCGFGQPHVVLFRENHISGTGESREVGNPGTLLGTNEECGAAPPALDRMPTDPALPRGVCEPHFQNSVPQGRLNLAQDASPGLDLQGRPIPQGRLKIGRDAIMDSLQPSLRDSIMLHDIPRTSVLG